MQYYNSKKIRPLSPHLGIYKPQISSVISIMHRTSGVANFIGLLCIVWWIASVTFSSSNPQDSLVWNFFNTIFGQLILIGWSFSVFFHFSTGIRHLLWDLGWGFDIKLMEASGIVAVIMAVTLTAITWTIIYNI